MKAKKILFPTDFSDFSDEGLKCAASLARDTGAKLIILHVEEPAAAYGGAGDVFYAGAEIDQDALRERLAAIMPSDKNITLEHHLKTGDPATEIVRMAKDEDVDLIVMATHGRTGLARLLMGSVAEAVVRRAPCPVFSLKHVRDELLEEDEHGK